MRYGDKESLALIVSLRAVRATKFGFGMVVAAMDEELPYRVVDDSGKFQITDPERRTIVSCHDARSAEHYASLLTQAYRSGYRAGYRAARHVEDS